MPFTIEGYQSENQKWVPASDVRLVNDEWVFGDSEFETLDRAIKVSWRFRVVMDVPVRLLCDGKALWSDEPESFVWHAEEALPVENTPVPFLERYAVLFSVLVLFCFVFLVVLFVMN